MESFSEEQMMWERIYAAMTKASSHEIPASHEPYFELVGKGLRVLRGNYSDICSSSRTAVAFLGELQSVFRLFEYWEASRAEGFSSNEASEVYDRLFELYECIMVILREYRLRTAPGEPLSREQEELFSYFENCGMWEPAEGTVVAHYYYSRIPRDILTEHRQGQ